MSADFKFVFPREKELFLNEEALEKLEVLKQDGDEWIMKFSNKIYRIRFEDFDPKTKSYSISVNGERVSLSLKDKLDMLIEKMGLTQHAEDNQSEILAPMPGLVVNLVVEPGDAVEAGSSLMTLEAMKMENVIKSKHPGKVKQWHVEQGQKVEKGQLLISFEVD